MEQQDVTAGEPPAVVAGQPRQYPCRIAGPGIEAAPGPARQSQSRARQYRIEQRAAQAGRRTKEAWPAANEFGQRPLGALQIIINKSNS